MWRHWLERPVVFLAAAIIVAQGCGFVPSPAKADDQGFWHIGNTWLYAMGPENASLFQTLKVTSDSGGKYVVALNGSHEYSVDPDYVKVDGSGEAAYDQATLAEESANAQVFMIYRHVNNTIYRNINAQAALSPGLRYLDLPLYPGKSWNATVHADVLTTPSHPNYPCNSSDLRYEFFVERETVVSIPAGNFTAMSVHVNVTYTATPNNGSDHYRYYYADAAKNIIRFEGIGGDEGEGLQPYDHSIFFGWSGGELKDTPLYLVSISLPTSHDEPTGPPLDLLPVIAIVAVVVVLLAAFLLWKRRSKGREM